MKSCKHKLSGWLTGWLGLQWAGSRFILEGKLHFNLISVICFGDNRRWGFLFCVLTSIYSRRCGVKITQNQFLSSLSTLLSQAPACVHHEMTRPIYNSNDDLMWHISLKRKRCHWNFSTVSNTVTQAKTFKNINLSQ